jgi:integrase
MSTLRAFVPDDFRQPRVRTIAWETFVDEFLELYQPPMKSPATLRHMKHALGLLTELGVQTTADLTTTAIAELVKSHSDGRSPNTVRSRLRSIQAACTFAEKACYVRISPFRIRGIATWVRATPARGKKHHSRAELKAVLALMREQKDTLTGWAQWRARRLYALTALLIYTAMRAGEAYHLQMTDLDLERGVIWIRPHADHRLKTAASEAPIPIAPALRPILEEWVLHRLDAPDELQVDLKCPWLFPNAYRNSPWTSGSAGCKPRDRMVAVGSQAGVLGFTPLSLRHSAITHMKMAFGLGEGFVKRVARHTNLDTQAYYTHDDLDDLRDGIGKVEY